MPAAEKGYHASQIRKLGLFCASEAFPRWVLPGFSDALLGFLVWKLSWSGLFPGFSDENPGKTQGSNPCFKTRILYGTRTLGRPIAYLQIGITAFPQETRKVAR